ncbi:glycosyltransferase [Azoarcus sp. KH32C]|uniref:glycosyltransferase n=1 Tax=Azoarcus sp. KH32C TaxID=748247 RepID=UPI0002386DF8|nr:glycosyltransferase [Azoarcus sp. KH32C]BAL26045.1 glycosyltransferase family protein [Azoarcus sp. KH32C]
MIEKKICFLVGSMAISGGTYVIIQHASHLQDQGYDVTLGVQEPFTEGTLVWHDRASTLRCVPIAVAKQESYDLVVATWWKTVFELKDFDSPRYAYFIQSIESRFYPEAETPLRALVDATYRFPLACVTEARWIQQYLADHFGQSATLVRNGIRKDVYSENGPAVAARDSASPRILVEGHFGVPFKNTALAVRLAKEAGCRDIWVLTGSPITWVPGVNRVFSRVPMVKTAEIYRSCDILVKLSTVEGMFGPPLEMFHCGGTAVVFDVSGHDEYIVDDINAFVVRQGDADGVVRTLRRLIRGREDLARLKDGALQTATAWPNWDQSSAEFCRWIEVTLRGPENDRESLFELTDRAHDDYGRDERSRLASSAGIVRRHKLSALASRFPQSLVRRVKQLEAAKEVMFGARRAF